MSISIMLTLLRYSHWSTVHVSYRLIFPEKHVVSNSVNWRVISFRVFIRLSNLNTFPTENNASFLQEILFRKWAAGKPWHRCYTEATATGSVGLEESPRERGTKGEAWEQKGNDRLSDRCINGLSPLRNTWLHFYYAFPANPERLWG